MNGSKSQRCNDLLSHIDDAVRANPSCPAKLMADIDELRNEVESLCENGKFEHAERVSKLAISILRRGGPLKE